MVRQQQVDPGSGDQKKESVLLNKRRRRDTNRVFCIKRDGINRGECVLVLVSTASLSPPGEALWCMRSLPVPGGPERGTGQVGLRERRGVKDREGIDSQ